MTHPIHPDYDLTLQRRVAAVLASSLGLTYGPRVEATAAAIVSMLNYSPLGLASKREQAACEAFGAEGAQHRFGATERQDWHRMLAKVAGYLAKALAGEPLLEERS